MSNQCTGKQISISIKIRSEGDKGWMQTLLLSEGKNEENRSQLTEREGGRRGILCPVPPMLGDGW